MATRQGSAKDRESVGKDIVTFAGTFIFLVVLMFAFNSFSHGTQDLYPTFLHKRSSLHPADGGINRHHRQYWRTPGRDFFGTGQRKSDAGRQL